MPAQEQPGARTQEDIDVLVGQVIALRASLKAVAQLVACTDDVLDLARIHVETLTAGLAGQGASQGVLQGIADVEKWLSAGTP